MRTKWLPWAAGFLDGEAAIRISYGRHQRQIYLDVHVGQAALAPLKRLQELFGGTVKRHTGKHYRRPYWIWRIYSGSAAKMLKAVRPWLLVKAEHAALAVQFWETCAKPVGTQRLNKTEHARRTTFYKRMQALQQKGLHLRRKAPR